MDLRADGGTTLARGLTSANPSTRLAAVMWAGANPAAQQIPVLIVQFTDEDDFFVRDMLTWALTQHDPDLVVTNLLATLPSTNDRVRAQCLHTLSKIARPDTWPAITVDLLTDPSDEVAQTAWRTAVILCPETERAALANTLCSQLGRGSDVVKLSLSSALVSLGDAARPLVKQFSRSTSPDVSAHAQATQQLFINPDLAFSSAMERANRTASLLDAPLVDQTLLAGD